MPASSRCAAARRRCCCLLDEVAAHLDADRRAALFDEICSTGAQAWMTGTDRSLFRPLGERAQYFHVENAEVSAAGGRA